MTNVFSSPTVQTIGAVLILSIVIAIGFYLVAICRDYTAQDQESASATQMNLEEMLRKGDISGQKFRTIESITELKLKPEPEFCSDNQH